MLELTLKVLWNLLKAVLYIAEALLSGLSESGKEVAKERMPEAINPRQNPHSWYYDQKR